VYLWDINRSVALPVAVVTGLATLVYACATIFPVLDDFCPYSTPASKMFHAICKAAARSRPIVFSAAHWLYIHTDNPQWLESIFEKMRDVLEPAMDHPADMALAVDGGVPMDIVTSQMLSWLIVNCEDSRSVDLALQAISGATDTLPQVHLMESGALMLVCQRLEACFHFDPNSRQHSLQHPSMSALANVYCRSFSVAFAGKKYCNVWDRWTCDFATEMEHWLDRFIYQQSISIHAMYVLLRHQSTTLEANWHCLGRLQSD
jgi:hypothetical protein